MQDSSNHSECFIGVRFVTFNFFRSRYIKTVYVDIQVLHIGKTIFPNEQIYDDMKKYIANH